MKFEEIVEAVNWTSVGDQMKAVDLPEWNRSTIIDMVFSVLEKWGPDDTNSCRILRVEDKFSVMGGQVGGTADLVRLSVNNGQTSIVDWKTAGKLDPKWEDRLRLSWQGPIYCYAYGASSYVYRGVEKSVSKVVDGRNVHRTREVNGAWPGAYGDVDVELELQRRLRMRAALESEAVWPRNKPGACGAFGRACDFLDLCETNTAPRRSIPLRPFSATGMERFGLCPERYRLETVLDGEGATEESNLGSAFHLAIAEVYRQLKELT